MRTALLGDVGHRCRVRLFSRWYSLARFLETEGLMKEAVRTPSAQHLNELKNQDLLLIHNKKEKGFL